MLNYYTSLKSCPMQNRCSTDVYTQIHMYYVFVLLIFVFSIFLNAKIVVVIFPFYFIFFFCLTAPVTLCVV